MTFAAAQNLTTTYTYDAKGRVIAAAYSDGWTTSYSYDAVDNRTRMVMATDGYHGSAALPPVQVLAGEKVEIDVASISRDPDVASKTLTAVTGASKGKLGIANGHVVYTPNPGESGIDSFTYTLTDGAVTDKASIRVEIAANGAPAAAR